MNPGHLPVEPILLGVAAVGAAVGQFFVSRRSGRRAWWALLIVLALGGALLLPPRWLDLPLVALAALIGLFVPSRVAWRAIAALLLGGVTYALGRFFPGGTLGFGLAFAAALGVALIAASVRRLRRMGRAAVLVPGELPPHDVELGGTVRAREQLPLPGTAERQVAAWELTVGEKRRRSAALVPVIAEAGTVLVDPREVRWDLRGSDTITGEDNVRQAADEAGIEPAALGVAGPGTATRTWLEDGAEVYVVGRPTWRPDPAGIASYRAAPVVPLFAGPQAFLADRPESTLACEARFRIASWALWLPPIVLAAVLIARR